MHYKNLCQYKYVTFPSLSLSLYLSLSLSLSLSFTLSLSPVGVKCTPPEAADALFSLNSRQLPAPLQRQSWLACSNDGEPGSIVLTPPLSSAPICHRSAGARCLQCCAPQMRWIISCPSRMLHSSHPWLLSPFCSWQFWHLVISLLLLPFNPYLLFSISSPFGCACVCVFSSFFQNYPLNTYCLGRIYRCIYIYTSKTGPQIQNPGKELPCGFTEKLKKMSSHSPSPLYYRGKKYT